MPRYRRPVFWISGLALFIVAGQTAPCGAAEPQVAFALKNGWVEFIIRQDGKPVPDVTILITDDKGNNFGEGESGKEGQTAFPLPPGPSFIVEIKTGPKTADPIRIFKTDEGVEPARVLLSYGLRPCCRSKLSKEPISAGIPLETPTESNDAPLPWLMVGITVLAFSLVAVNLWLLKRRYPGAT